MNFLKDIVIPVSLCLLIGWTLSKAIVFFITKFS